MLTLTAWIEVGIATLALYFARRLLTKAPAPLPPGPKPLPLLGNVFDMPEDQKTWLKWARLGELYGDICSLRVFGNTFIILNSKRLAIEMLEKKSVIYSDRPVFHMGGELAGWNNITVLLRYGESFLRQSNDIRNVMGTSASMKQFHSIEEAEMRKFLRRVLERPSDLAAEIRHAVGAIILDISYGYKVGKENDPLVALADKALEQFSLAMLPGAYLVDIMPFLKYVPMWFPGAGFKKHAQYMRETLHGMADKPYRQVKDKMAAGTASASCTSIILGSQELTKETEHSVKWSVASMYAGGSNTPVAAIYAFYLAMTLHPEIQRRVHAEIDTVCGSNRLPTLADRDHLPYTNAVCLEVHRWHAAAPTGTPHRVTEDDIQDGYLIPKGSWVIVNIWKLLNDPQVYPSPFTFDPTRYLGPDPQPDPREIAFGFGKRICPGLVLADEMVFLSCAQSLAVFDITKAVENGIAVVPVHRQGAGVISHPEPFKCNIKPRSNEALALVKSND